MSDQITPDTARANLVALLESPPERTAEFRDWQRQAIAAKLMYKEALESELGYWPAENSDFLSAFDQRTLGLMVVLTESENTAQVESASARVRKLAEMLPGQSGASKDGASPDFTSFTKDGKKYEFTKMQAKFVRALYEAKGHTLSREKLADEVGSCAHPFRPDNLFREKKGGMHEAWRTLIVRPRKGTYRLDI